MKNLLPLAFVASLAACQASESNYQAAAAEQAAPVPATPAPAAPDAQQAGGTTTPSGLRFETLTPGNGPHPQMGDTVLVTYEGRLTNGTMFDSSTQPVPMTVGQLIPGFNEGLMLMSKGGRYRLHIPAAIGYGAEGAGGGVIPPNADLVFDVTLVDIGQPGGQPAG
jgi:FKBP-type peptidyl-prolyl cis-trans isomerase FkpA